MPEEKNNPVKEELKRLARRLREENEILGRLIESLYAQIIPVPGKTKNKKIKK